MIVIITSICRSSRVDDGWEFSVSCFLKHEGTHGFSHVCSKGALPFDAREKWTTLRPVGPSPTFTLPADVVIVCKVVVRIVTHLFATAYVRRRAWKNNIIKYVLQLNRLPSSVLPTVPVHDAYSARDTGVERGTSDALRPRLSGQLPVCRACFRCGRRSRSRLWMLDFKCTHIL